MTEIVSSRKEFHGTIGAVVYTREAREGLVPAIERLPFPGKLTYDPQALADTLEVKDLLKVSNAADTAEMYGIMPFTVPDAGNHIYFHGFADRNITPKFAGFLGKNISQFLREERVIDVPFTLQDYAKLFQTGWFGALCNQMALTGNGMIQPGITDAGGLETFMAAFTERKNVPEQILRLEQQPGMGLYTVGVTDEAMAIIRSRLPHDRSVGCPVARTSVMVTPDQHDFLEQHGHIGDSSGFFASETGVTQGGLLKLVQGDYTAIDDVLCAWGQYVDRYADHLLRHRYGPEYIEATSANQYVVLD